MSREEDHHSLVKWEGFETKKKCVTIQRWYCSSGILNRCLSSKTGNECHALCGYRKLKEDESIAKRYM